MERMLSGSKFQARGPAMEKARSPNLVLVAGMSYFPADADRRGARNGSDEISVTELSR